MALCKNPPCRSSSVNIMINHAKKKSFTTKDEWTMNKKKERNCVSEYSLARWESIFWIRVAQKRMKRSIRRFEKNCTIRRRCKVKATQFLSFFFVEILFLHLMRKHKPLCCVFIQMATAERGGEDASVWNKQRQFDENNNKQISSPSINIWEYWYRKKSHTTHHVIRD